MDRESFIRETIVPAEQKFNVGDVVKLSEKGLAWAKKYCDEHPENTKVNYDFYKNIKASVTGMYLKGNSVFIRWNFFDRCSFLTEHLELCTPEEVSGLSFIPVMGSNREKG